MRWALDISTAQCGHKQRPHALTKPFTKAISSVDKKLITKIAAAGARGLRLTDGEVEILYPITPTT